MPRNPAAKKSNNRHENGLVGPGKRVTKQKSNGHLNGAAKGAGPSESVSHPPRQDSTVASPPTENSLSGPPDADHDLTKTSSLHTGKPHDLDLSAAKDLDKEVKRDTNGSTMLQNRRGDLANARSRSGHDLNAFQLASTILRSRPACDTISLLIVLLALPSMILTIVQALFASLTLMPGGGAPVSLFSLLDIFQGPAGAPSISTIAVVDVFGFALWICLWNWAQNFALDLAQIQIAITLGNGNAGKSGGVTTFCFASILLLHSVRSKGVRRFLFSNFVPVDLLSQIGLGDYLKYLPSDADFGQSPSHPSKIRSLFAIHIVSQAIMAFARRKITSSNQPIGTVKSKRIDTEALAGSVSDTSGLDGSVATGMSSGIDFQPPLTPGFKDGKERTMTAKKRRRHANQIRSRQPFWAALASTKVHVLREVEHNKGLPAVTNNQGNPFEVAHEDRVWITEVRPSSISFDAIYLSGHDQNQSSSESRPFHVRINDAKWHSVCLEALDSNAASDAMVAQWSGVISGLAPNCTYTCTFFRGEGDEEFASVMVKTPILLDKDVPSSLVSMPVRQSTRPSSPTTTLKNSISTAEAKTNDARNRFHKARRQHKTLQLKLEKELEALQARLKSSNDDNKHRQKLLQAERSQEQTHELISALDAQLEGLETDPIEGIDTYVSSKEAYEHQIKLLADANESLSKARSEANNGLSAANNDLHAVVTRKERLSGRNTKLTEQHDRITHANVEGLNEKERKAADSNAKDLDHQRREVELVNQIRLMETEASNARARWEANCRELEVLEKHDWQQRQLMLQSSGPLTPEGDLPGTRPQPQHARPYAFGSFQAFPNSPVIPEVQSSPFLAYAKTLPSSDARRPRSDTNRSIGGLSNFSAEFEDADPIPPMPSTSEYDVPDRKGSGSSRGKHNGSPATGAMGIAFSPQRGSYSPGHMPGSTTW